jgi:hypothetical protein
MDHWKSHSRQWKLSRYFIPENFLENEPEPAHLHPPEYALQRFRGKQIKLVGKILLPVSFGDLDNARTETLTFDVVDIYHLYLAIFGRGFMNKFDVVIRQQFLCMKISAPKGVITVFGDEQEAKNVEKGHTPGQANVYQLKTAEERKEP